MAAGNETVYLKAEQNVEVTKHEVTLGDVLTMECSNPNITNRLKTIRLLKVPEHGQKLFVISILRVIELIHEVYPHLDIQNLGEVDVILTFEQQKTPNRWVHALKVLFVVLVSFSGAAFSIMAFNNDVATTRMFGQIYKLLTGQTSEGFTILELTYSIGLTVGILIFFNHFGGKKFSADPTPMEVEMRLYENDIQMTQVQNYSRKEQEIDVGKTNPTGISGT